MGGKPLLLRSSNRQHAESGMQNRTHQRRATLDGSEWKVSEGSVWMGRQPITRDKLGLVRFEKMPAGSVVKLFDCVLHVLPEPSQLGGS